MSCVDNVVGECLDRVMPTERDSTTDVSSHHLEGPHRGGLAQRLNWLPAGAREANDGIVSVAATLAVGRP